MWRDPKGEFGLSRSKTVSEVFVNPPLKYVVIKGSREYTILGNLKDVTYRFKKGKLVYSLDSNEQENAVRHRAYEIATLLGNVQKFAKKHMDAIRKIPASNEYWASELEVLEKVVAMELKERMQLNPQIRSLFYKVEYGFHRYG